MKVRKANKSKVWLIAMILLVVVSIATGIILTPRTYAATTENGLFDYTVNYDNTVTITGCNNIGIVDIVIPSTIDGYQVTNIATGTFSASSAVTVYIPSSILNIEDEAFQLCNFLNSISVDDNNAKYSSENGVLFDKNKSKIIRYPQEKSGSSYIIPDSVVSIESGAFYNCTGLNSIEIPENVTNIGKRAFKNCNISSVNLPEGITEIPTSAFEGCTALTSISIPNTVTSIGGDAFSWCQNLKEIMLPDQLVSIGQNAFFSCNIASIEIPSSVETIALDAFSCNYNLTCAVMPNSLEEIGNSIFRGSDSNLKIYLIKGSLAESYASKESYLYEYLYLNEINIKEPPTKTIYNIRDSFSDDGMIVNAVYSYGDSKTVEYKISSDDYTINPSEPLIFGTTLVTVSYEHNGITKTVSQSITVVDNIKPTIDSVTGNATEWTNQNITLTINATDNESGIAGYSFDNGTTWQTTNTKTYTENTTGIIVQVKDNKENISTYGEIINIDKIDKTAPTMTISPNGATISQSQNVTITAEDSGGSGLNSNNSYQYQLGTSSTVVPTGTWQDYTSGTEFTIGEGLTGDYYLWIKTIIDNAGNESAETEYILSNKFTFDNSEEADTIAPELSIEYSITQLTNKSVTATIKSNEEIQEVDGWIISEDDKTLTKVYTKNTTEDIDVYDISGNKSTIQVKVANIDKTKPEFSVKYDITQPSNKSVTATITANEELQQLEGWTISEDCTTLTKIYTENTEESIEVYDLAGNKATIQIKIANIDKTEIQATVEYSTTILTNKNVIVKIILNKEIQEINGWTLSDDKMTLTKEYTENADENVKIQDSVGNEREIKISVQNIDKLAPTVKVEYSTLKQTNKSLTVSISADEELQSLEGWSLEDDGKTLTKIYTKNITENIDVYDLAGNKVTAGIAINNIDKTLPSIEVKYSTTQKTNEDVIVTIVSDEQLQEVNGWTISEDRKTLTKKYEKNSMETVKVYDIAGNEIEVKVSVNNIDKTTIQEKEENGVESFETPDTVPTRLPDTGSYNLIGVIIITIIVSIILWTKNRKYKDIK